MGEAKFTHRRGKATFLSALGLGLAVLAHGLYDFMVFSLDSRPFMLMTLPVFLVLAWVIFFKAVVVINNYVKAFGRFVQYLPGYIEAVFK